MSPWVGGGVGVALGVVAVVGCGLLVVTPPTGGWVAAVPSFVGAELGAELGAEFGVAEGVAVEGATTGGVVFIRLPPRTRPVPAATSASAAIPVMAVRRRRSRFAPACTRPSMASGLVM